MGRSPKARTELARLEGETPILVENAKGLDLDALRTARDEAREALEALPTLGAERSGHHCHARRGGTR